MLFPVEHMAVLSPHPKEMDPLDFSDLAGRSEGRELATHVLPADAGV